MAQIINDPNDPNKQNQPNSPQNPPGGQNPVVQGTNTSAPTSTGQAQPVKSAYPTMGQAASQPARNRQQGSGFTNLQRVMGANQNNRLGQTVGQGIQGTQQKYGQNVQQSGQQFGQQAGAARLDTEQNRQYVQNTLGNAIQDPTKVGQAEYDQFGNLRAGKYAGPQDLQNYSELQAQAQDVGQLGDLTRSAGGRQALLQRFIGGNKGYTQGQQNLDTLLLGQSGQNQLAQARVGSRSANPALAQQEAAARALAQQYAGENKAFGENVLGQVGTAKQAQLDILTKSMQDAQAQKDQDIDEIKKKLATTNAGDIALTQRQAQMLGLKGGEEFNAGALTAFNPADVKASLQNVASQKDYAVQNALAKLAQGSGAVAEGFTDPNQAGTFFQNQYGFREDQLKQAQDEAKAAAQAALDAQQRRYNAAGQAIGGSDFQKYQNNIGQEFGSGQLYNTQAKSQYFQNQANEIQKQLDAIKATADVKSLAQQLADARSRGDNDAASKIAMQMMFGGQNAAWEMSTLPKIDPNQLKFEDRNSTVASPERFAWQNQALKAPIYDTNVSGGNLGDISTYNDRVAQLYGSKQSAIDTYQQILDAYKNQAKRYEDATNAYKQAQTGAEQKASQAEQQYGYKQTGLGGLQGRKVMIDDEEAARQAALLAMSGMSGATPFGVPINRNRMS